MGDFQNYYFVFGKLYIILSVYQVLFFSTDRRPVLILNLPARKIKNYRFVVLFIFM